MKAMGGMRHDLKMGMDVKAKKTLKGAKFVTRVYLDASQTSYTVPFGAKYCVAKVLGAGGHCIVDAASPTSGFYVAGGGAAYAKSTFKVASGQNLATQIGRYGQTSQLRETWVKQDGKVAVLASGGNPSNLDVMGTGGNYATGDEGIPGEDPVLDSGFLFAGAALGDSGDADSVLCAGYGVVIATSNPTVAAIQSGYGGGGAVFYNGSASTAEVSGKGGLIVLEFYTGDPR